MYDKYCEKCGLSIYSKDKLCISCKKVECIESTYKSRIVWWHNPIFGKNINPKPGEHYTIANYEIIDRWNPVGSVEEVNIPRNNNPKKGEF